MEIFATIFAGLGLFIIGLNGLTKGMRTISSHRLHRLVQTSTSNRFLSALVGTLTGIITQSATAVTFIVVSMVSSGMIGLMQGLFITAWANIGTASLVFVAMLDIHLYLYIFIGLLGASYYFGFDRREPQSSLLSLFVSISLLLLGLLLIKQGSVPIKESSLLLDWLGHSSQQIIVLMLAGTFITLVTQSASSTSAIVVSLVASEVLDFYQASSLIIGANLGAGISVYIIGRNLLGSAKKIVMMQTLNKVSGVIVLTPLFLYEIITGTTLFALIETHLGSTLVATTAFVFVIQLTAALVMSLLAKQVICLLDHVVKEDLSEETRKPKYLQKLALNDTESALDLLEKEQLRIVSFLPSLLDSPRAENNITPLESLSESLQSLITQCDSFCLELINKSHNAKTLESVLAAKKRNDLLFGINTNLKLFVSQVDQKGQGKTSEVIRNNLLEGLHFVLQFLDETKEQTEELENLIIITDDKSTIMQRARESLIQNKEDNDSETLSNMLAATSHFERLIWLINSYARALDILAQTKKP